MQWLKLLFVENRQRQKNKLLKKNLCDIKIAFYIDRDKGRVRQARAIQIRFKSERNRVIMFEKEKGQSSGQKQGKNEN